MPWEQSATFFSSLELDIPLFCQPSGVRSREFKNSYFPQESNVPPALYSFSMHLWIIQIVFTVHPALPCLGLLEGLCYQTWVLHGCRRLVHGRRDPQEDLLSPGDPAWGQRQTPTH